MAEAARLPEAPGLRGWKPSRTACRSLPPSWRHDLGIPDDLAEEVLRLRGYDQIPSALPPLEGSPEPLSRDYLKRRQLASGWPIWGSTRP